MKLKKSMVTISVILVGAFTIFLGIQLADAKKNNLEELDAKDAFLEDGHNMGTPPKPSVETEKLNKLHQEIVAMSNDQIIAEFKMLNEQARRDSMLASENGGNLNLNEHPDKKEMLIRLALLRAERSRRGLVAHGVTR